MGRLRAITLCLAVMATCPAGLSGVAQAAESIELEKAMLLSVEGSLVISPDGSVSEYTITSDTTPEIDALLQQVIPRWTFEPVLIDGKPGRARTKVRLSLAAVQAGSDYKVGVENVVFPGGLSAMDQVRASQGTPVEAIGRSMNPPVYPRDQERAGVTGRVLLALHFTQDGRIVDVVPVQTMLFGKRRESPQAVRQFERASVDAARKWSMEVRQKPGLPTTERDFTAYTTIEYMLGLPGAPGASNNDAPPGHWRQVARTPKRPLPWLAGLDAPEIGVADVVQGELIPLANAPRLKTPLANPAN